MASKTELLREREWRRCRGKGPTDLRALVYWCEKYAYIRHPERGSILFALRPAQYEILETWLNERYSIVLKARQIGWSTLVAVYALWLAFFYEDQLVLMLSKGEREAEKLLEKSTYAYNRLPPWMQERGPKRLTKNLKKLGFDNSSVVESLPSKEDPGRSATASLVIVDEWAFLENAEEAWASIEPIADVGGRVIGLSTANGSGDFFHQHWIKATAGINDFKPMFYPWWANDERDENWYESKKRGMLEWQLHQEYPSTPEEAFIKSGNPVFDVDALDKIALEEPHTGRLVTDIPGTSKKGPVFNREKGGPLRIFRYPELGEAYAIGADVAEGLEHGDFSSAHVVSLKSFEVVAHWHGHIDPDLFGTDILQPLGYYYNVALVGPEVNNHGLTTCKALQRENYPKLYYRRTLDQRTKEQRLQVGWSTNVASKPLMIDELIRAVRDGLWLADAVTIAEMRTFVRDEKGRMSGQPFDDRVISLAIAVQMVQFVTAREYQTPEDDYGTWNYHFRRLHKPAERQPLGSNNVRRAS